jgi:adenylyltransferase/sulfurtransferase
MPPSNAPPLEISCHAVKAKLDAGESLLLLDCREKDEYAVAKIEAATPLPMSELAARIAELEAYRDRPIVVHCHLGGRSLRVVHWLRAQGFSQAQSMAGGIDSWSETIDRSVPRY